MLLKVLAVTNYAEPIEGFIDKLAFGGQMLLIGIGTVFAVLCLLWVCLAVFEKVFKNLSVKKKESTVEPTTPVEVVEDVSNDGEIIAAIAAAIAMAESDAPQTKFRVVSFKRK